MENFVVFVLDFMHWWFFMWIPTNSGCCNWFTTPRFIALIRDL
jgi:hypothetical protein